MLVTDADLVQSPPTAARERQRESCGLRVGTYEMYFIRTMRTVLDLARWARLPKETLAFRMAEVWHTVATTPEHENALPRDSMDAMLAVEARNDWLKFHPEDNRVQLDAIVAFDALGEVR